MVVKNILKAVFHEAPLIMGVITTVIFFTIGKGWLDGLGSLPVFAFYFVWLFAVMIWCAFGVVHHAEALAELLGEPYGTLILTISVIGIEVTILTTIMLTGDANPTLARDTMFAVLMITLNGMVGLALMIGAIKYGQQQYNLQGAIAFLAVVSPLSVIALVLPEFTTSTVEPRFTKSQATVFALLTAFLYAVFLLIQTKRHRSFFTEPQHASVRGLIPEEAATHPHRRRGSVIFHAFLLLATLLPVVLLTKPLARMLDFGIEQAGMPTPLGAILIALLILSPEATAAFQAARRNQLQRSVNICLGSAVSTIGLTVPTVLAISVITGTPLDLGLGHVEIILLAVTLFVAQMTFSGVPTNILLGVTHLVLFAGYLMLALYP